MKTIFSSVFAALALAALSVNATVYTDATGDNYGSADADITSVVVTNDGNNVAFTILLNQGATNGISANYLVGIQVVGGPQGQTNINNLTSGVTAGNPWGNRAGISTGENFFIGCFPNGSGYSGGAKLYQYTNDAPGGWSGQIGSTASITEITNGTPSITFSFPLTALGLSAGSNFNFDVWTSYGSPGGQGAYDALDSSVQAPGEPYAPTNASYDSATAAGSTLANYTVVSAAAYQASVTFQINMSVAITQGIFNPSFGDYVEARGSFDNWPTGDHAGVLLTNVPGTSNYVGTFVTNNLSLGTTVEYKFVIDSGVTWEGNIRTGRRAKPHVHADQHPADSAVCLLEQRHRHQHLSGAVHDQHGGAGCAGKFHTRFGHHLRQWRLGKLERLRPPIISNRRPECLYRNSGDGIFAGHDN